MKKIENVIMIIAVVIILFLLCILFIPGFNYKLITIKSGSMEPAIKTGSVIIIKNQDDYVKNDIITFFKEQDNLVTHRIVAVMEDGSSYKTKGDANNADDETIVKKSVVTGKTIIIIPYFGWVTNFLRTKTGIMIFILVPSMYFIGREVLKIKKELKKQKDTVNKKDEIKK